MDRGAWQATLQRVTRTRMQLSTCTAKNYSTVLEIFHLLTLTLLLVYKSALAPAVLGMEPVHSLSPITAFPE